MRIKSKQVIHNVQILDASGSFAGPNYDTALEGINAEQRKLQEDNTTRYTQTVIEFSSGFNNTTSITEHSFMRPIKTCQPVKGRGAAGGTPLYETVGVTLERLLLGIEEDDKVLVKIATDGQENASKGIYANPLALKELISKCEEKGFTVVFVGTEADVFEVVQNVGIHMSNTYARENNPKSINMSYMMMADNTVTYASRSAGGQSVKEDFFQKKD